MAFWQLKNGNYIEFVVTGNAYPFFLRKQETKVLTHSFLMDKQ